MQLAPPGRLLGFREIAHHVFPLVPLAALHRHLAEHLAHGRTQALGAIEHHQQPGRGAKAALLKLAQERGAHPLVFRRRLDQPEQALLPRARHPQGHHQLVLSEALPVQHHHQPLGVIQPPLGRLAQVPRTGLNKPPRDAGLRQPERRGHRFGGQGVLPAGQSPEHPPEQPQIQGPWRLQLPIGLQRDLPPARSRTRGTRIGSLLIGQVDRARLPPQRTTAGAPSPRPYRGPASAVTSWVSASPTA